MHKRQTGFFNLAVLLSLVLSLMTGPVGAGVPVVHAAPSEALLLSLTPQALPFSQNCPPST